MFDLESVPDTPPAYLEFIFIRSSGLAECITSIRARNQLMQLLAEEHPELELSRLPLPIFRAHFTRLVQVADAFFSLCRVQAWFCAMHALRYQGKEADAASYREQFIRESGSSENAARWLAMSPPDFLTESIKRLRAKGQEIEQLATQIRDCDEKEALLIPEHIRSGGKHTVGRTGQQALDGSLRMKPISDEIEERIEALRRSLLT